MTRSYMANKVCFIDTSGFKALIDKKDEFTRSAFLCWDKLEKEDWSFLSSNYVLDETYTFIRLRCGKDFVDVFREKLSESWSTKIVRVTVADERNAWKWFSKDWSKLSYTDCVSFAIMERLGIKSFFGFDKHFSRAGFKSVV